MKQTKRTLNYHIEKLRDNKMTVLCKIQDGHFHVDLNETNSLKGQLVRQEGLEPPTYWFVASHSIQLSYCRMSTDSF